MALSDLALVTLVEAKNYLRVDAAASLRIEAEYVGVGDGSGLTFSLDNTPIGGSLQLYVDNVLQVETDDYSISGADITFVTAPTNGDPITASYDKTASSDTFLSYDDDLLETLIEAATKKAEAYTGLAFVRGSLTEEHVGDGTTILRLYRRPVVKITSVGRTDRERAGIGDGSTVEFTLQDNPMSDSLILYVDNTLQVVTNDYAISGATITFVSAPSDGAIITAAYNVLINVYAYEERLSIGRLYYDNGWTANKHFTVIYTAGYAATRAATQALVPDAVVAVLIAVAAWYENRMGIKLQDVSGIGSIDYGDPEGLPLASKKKLDALRVDIL